MSTAAALSKLEEAIKARFPDLQPHFHSGISEAEFMRLEGQLSPYRLPRECRDLYEWHNGAREPLELIPGYSFLSLAEAIDEYRMQLKIFGGTEGFNPLWFPLFSFQGDIYAVVLSSEGTNRSPVYLSFNQDTEIRLMYSDFDTLLAVSTRCFESNAYFLDDGYLAEDEEKVERIKSEFGEAAPVEHVDGESSFSKFFTQSWPESWKSAIGRTDEDYVAKGADNTVAEYKSDPKRSRLHVAITGVLGTSSHTILDIRDETGQMSVLCLNTAVGAREIQISRHYEMEVEPSREELSPHESCEGVVRHVLLRE